MRDAYPFIGHRTARVVTHNLDEWRERTFDLPVDGTRVGQQRIERRGPKRFFEVEYPLPDEVVRGKRHVTVRFEATESYEIGCVFDVRMIRANHNRAEWKSRKRADTFKLITV